MLLVAAARSDRPFCRSVVSTPHSHHFSKLLECESRPCSKLIKSSEINTRETRSHIKLSSPRPLSTMSTWNKHYHWKTKGCTAWSKEYFTKNFLEQSLTLDSGEVLKVTRLDSFEGDVELGNRKGKLITIYDLDVSLKWSASSKEAAEEVAGGKIRFPEISHEIEDQNDDYTWETELESEIGNGSRNDKDKIYQSVRKVFIEKQLLPILKSFRSTLIDTHARDLGHDESSTASSSGTATPSQQPSSASSATKTTATSTVKTTSTTKSKVAVSDEVIELEGNNACSKADLWDILTNQARIPMWTRSPAEVNTPTTHIIKELPTNLLYSILLRSSCHCQTTSSLCSTET